MLRKRSKEVNRTRIRASFRRLINAAGDGFRHRQRPRRKYDRHHATQRRQMLKRRQCRDDIASVGQHPCLEPAPRRTAALERHQRTCSYGDITHAGGADS